MTGDAEEMLRLSRDATPAVGTTNHPLNWCKSEATVPRSANILHTFETRRLVKAFLRRYFSFSYYQYNVYTQVLSKERLMPYNKDLKDTSSCTFCRQRQQMKRSLCVTSSPDSAVPTARVNLTSTTTNIISLHGTSNVASAFSSSVNVNDVTDQKDTFIELPNARNYQKEENGVNKHKGETSSVFLSKVQQTANLRKSRLFHTSLPQQCLLHRVPSQIPRLRQTTLFPQLNILLILFLVLFLVTDVTAVWWSPGSTSKLVNTSRICQWARQIGGKQWEMCRRQSPVIEQIRQGIELGISTCQSELRHHRWNCTQISKAYFARVMSQDTSETAFLQALTSAAITYQVTTACAKGHISDCGCANNRRLRNRLLRLEARKRNVTVDEDKLRIAVDNFEWGGCGDNMEYGMLKSKQFLDLTSATTHKSRGALRNQIKARNEEAGRLAIKNYGKKKCQCHGLSGSCTMWTCWRYMPRFDEVKVRIRRRYNSAVRVIVGNDKKTLIPLRRRLWGRRKVRIRNMRSVPRQSSRSQGRTRTKHGRNVAARGYKGNPGSRNRYRKQRQRGFSKEDIIYVQKSPTFCTLSKKQGSLGTRGRLCDPTVRGIGSCRYLCCGRGVISREVVEEKSCNCRFEFCCNVSCSTCVERKTLHYCL